MSDRKKSAIVNDSERLERTISRWFMFTLNDSAYRCFFPPAYRFLSFLIVKCEPTLTDRRLKLIQHAQKELENVQNIDFVFADINGTCKVMFIHKVNGSLFADFDDEMGIASIIGSIGAPQEMMYDEFKGASNDETLVK